ncbi:hypothetical protein CEXT_508111 [Caerostris extrusa]|uniref:Uncharacterized protein n=1 Tax=Caerostris extrusa TaxID=172846 RepID=A0AAV4Y012_CAEEX|nr:hypothetical protein CEXT_508111 [Caerostris extrusa]
MFQFSIISCISFPNEFGYGFFDSKLLLPITNLLSLQSCLVQHTPRFCRYAQTSGEKLTLGCSFTTFALVLKVLLPVELRVNDYFATFLRLSKTITLGATSQGTNA